MYCRAIVETHSCQKFKTLAKTSLHYRCNKFSYPAFKERSEGEPGEVVEDLEVSTSVEPDK
jgi:hypothetical protein